MGRRVRPTAATLASAAAALGLVLLQSSLPAQCSDPLSPSQTQLFRRHVILETDFNSEGGISFPGVVSRLECGALFQFNRGNNGSGGNNQINSFTVDLVTKTCQLGQTASGYTSVPSGLAVWALRESMNGEGINLVIFKN